MKIKRFYESEQIDISTERIDEIVENIKQFSSNLLEREKFIESLLTELENYKSDSSKGNDQIDDSIASLQVIKRDIDSIQDKIDTVSSNLKDYNQGGRKYLYTENK